MPFPGNRIFPEKNREIPGPKQSGTSYSRSQFSTGIQDRLFPGLIIITVPNKKNPGWYCLLRFSRKSLEIRYCSGISRMVLSSPVSSRLFPGFFPNFLEWRDQKTLVSSRYRQFGKWVQVSSHLFSFKTSSWTQTSITLLLGSFLLCYTNKPFFSLETNYRSLWVILCLSFYTTVYAVRFKSHLNRDSRT